MNITQDIKYIGVNDHEVDLFEGQYDVPNGMAYNSYAIMDEKIAIMDTVDANFTEDGENWTELAPDTIVSMNMWGFVPSFLKELESKFAAFMKTLAVSNPEKAEFFLPFAVDELLHEGKATAKVLRSADKWYGVTYAADKPQVVAALRAMADEGKYPDGLWGN
jgi:hypothetical protein